MSDAYVIDLSSSSPSWTRVTPLPSVRMSHACSAAVVGDRDVVVIAGGSGDVDGKLVRLSDVWIYDAKDDVYEEVAAMPEAIDFVSSRNYGIVKRLLVKIIS